MSRFAFEFTGRVAAYQLGRWTYSVLYLPEDLAAELRMKENPRLRVRGGRWGSFHLSAPGSLLEGSGI